MNTLKRREFLEFIGNTGLSLSLSNLFVGCSSLSENLKNPNLPFKPIKPNNKDGLFLAEGFNYYILSKFNDCLGENLNFGANNDFLCFLPMPYKINEALLWVNHEYLHPVIAHELKLPSLSRSKKEIESEQKMVGGSILHIKNESQKWSVIKNSKFNRRLDGTTRIPFSNSTKIFGVSEAVGTVANCAGGKTPWNTFLTSEENYHIFYGDVSFYNKKRAHLETKKDDLLEWHKHFPFPPEHYGWVTEVEPFTGKAVKHIALGRAAHEGSTVTLTKNKKRAVVYMGEDRQGGYIFKFVSESPNSLNSGTLYAADTVNGRWIPLDIKKNPKLKKYFDSQLDVLIYSHYAAEFVGATPQDRPEDIEINPQNGDVIISLTNNKVTNNLFGGLLRIREEIDYDSVSFESSVFLAGGSINGFSCPDNLCFDPKGNLWMTTDMSEKDMNRSEFKEFKNNGLFYIPLSGSDAGKAFQVASAPVDAELTGPCFSDDGKTLFLSVQHPGASTTDPQDYKSHWPLGGSHRPLSSVVGISGEALNKLMS